VQNREREHGAQARNGHGRSAVSGEHGDGSGHQRRVEQQYGEKLPVPRGGDQVHDIVEQPFAPCLDVQEGGTGMVEADPGVVAGEQLKVLGLPHRDRVGCEVGVFVDSRGEQVGVACHQDGADHQETGQPRPDGRRQAARAKDSAGAPQVPG
jgi:hypothetical protein